MPYVRSHPSATPELNSSEVAVERRPPPCLHPICSAGTFRVPCVARSPSIARHKSRQHEHPSPRKLCRCVVGWLVFKSCCFVIIVSDCQVSSLVEARETARAGGAQSTAGASTNATNNDDTVEPRTSRNQPGEPAGRTADESGAAGNSGPRAPAPRNATRAQAENGGRPRPPQPGGSHRHDENADPSGVVDLSSSSSSSEGNADTPLSSQGRRATDTEGQQRSRSASGKGGVVGSSRPSGSGSGVFNPCAAATGPGSTPARSAAASTRARVRNPYSASTLSATSSAAETVGTARSESQQGAARSRSSGSSGGQGRPRGREVSVGGESDFFALYP